MFTYLLENPRALYIAVWRNHYLDHDSFSLGCMLAPLLGVNEESSSEETRSFIKQARHITTEECQFHWRKCSLPACATNADDAQLLSLKMLQPSPESSSIERGQQDQI
jgi:hypothetical protein